MTEPEIGSYRDAVGARHTLVVRQTPDGDWHVLDIDVTSGTAQVVEAAGAARRDGRLQITTRRRADHFLRGGQAGGGDWLGPLLALAARHADAGEEVFLAPAIRAQPRGDKHAVSETRFIWIDVDR